MRAMHVLNGKKPGWKNNWRRLQLWNVIKLEKTGSYLKNNIKNYGQILYMSSRCVTVYIYTHSCARTGKEIYASLPLPPLRCARTDVLNLLVFIIDLHEVLRYCKIHKFVDDAIFLMQCLPCETLFPLDLLTLPL